MSKRKGDPGYAAGWCIHYRSPSDGKGGDVLTCEAGVEYSTFHSVKFQARPCFLNKKGESEPNSAHCECLRRPTTEEIAAHEEWLNGRMTTLTTVMVGISDWRKKHKGRSFGEIIECPACKGRLHLSIAASNGHVHGRCATEGCVIWME